jgi:tetratricopeptide (TPR) repeat protein
MAVSPERFAMLLTDAIHRIKRVENKPITVIQDELGYALGRDGGSAIEYWRKGNLPPGRRDIEDLAQLLIKRGQLERAWLEGFLESADYGLAAQALCDRLFATQPQLDVTSGRRDEAQRRASPFLAPLLTPYFVGREQEQAQLRQLLLKPHDSSIVALVGMGGVGKTALAIQTAHSLREHFTDGVLWADAATGNPLSILQAWAQALGHDLSLINELASRAAALRGILAERKVLVILDDVRSPETVRPLLPGVSSCAVLLTTRDQDSARALNAHPYELDELSEQDGLNLLSEIVGQERVAKELTVACEICRLAHYLPLALEICAKQLARVNWQQFAHLEQRLRDEAHRLDQLSLKDLNVRAAFEVSWQTLTPKQRKIFAMLSPFAGRPFTAAASAHIAQHSEEDVTDELVALVALSLVKSTSPGVFQQHPLLAEFAESHLDDSVQTYQRFAEYYLIFCQDQRHKSLMLEGEFGNIMHAMQTSFVQQQWRMVMDYVDVLAEAWLRRARYREGRLGLQWGCTAARSLGKSEALAGYLIRWGLLCAEQNDQAEARLHWEEALQLASESGGNAQVAEAQYHMARLALEQGQYEDVDEQLIDAQAIHQSLGNQVGVAAVLHLRALMLHRLNQYETSNGLLAEALAIQEREQDIPGILATLRALTNNALMQYQHEEAERYCTQGMRLAREHNDHSELTKCYANLATLYRRLERYDEALEYAEKAITWFRQMGNRVFMAEALYEKSMTLKLANAYATSLQAGQQSLAILQELQDEYDQVFCLNHLGDLHWRLGELAEARRLWSGALDLAKLLHHPLTAELDARLKDPPLS